MHDFSGKVAVVTGGASGIGLALARRFAGEGMAVVIGDVEEPALREAAQALRDSGADALGVVTDVTDPDQVDALGAAALDAHGAVHVFCNNAGVGGGGLTWEMPLSEWEWVLGVNLWGVIHGIRTFVPLLMAHDDAHIVNTASMAGLVAAPFMGPYCASKHAVVAISQTLHHEQQMLGGALKVHVLCPGWVRTRIAEADRNRPAHLRPPGEPAETVPREVLEGFVASGMDPAAVADAVMSAMRDDRFWILTHHDDDTWREALDAVQASVREGTNPVLRGLR